MAGAEWWMDGWSGARSAENLAEVLAVLYPIAVNQLLTNRRLHTGEAYEVASRIIQRLMDEYARGKTYTVPPQVVVRNYCKYMAKGYLAEREYSRYDSLDAPAPIDGEGNEVARPAPVDRSVRIEDTVVAAEYVYSLLDDPSIPQGELVVIEMRYLQGMDIADIAETLGIKRNAVDQRLHRALRRLRDLSLGA